MSLICMLLCFENASKYSSQQWSGYKNSKGCQSLGPDWNISSAIRWILVQFCLDIHVAKKMNPTDSCDFYPTLALHVN